MTKKPADEQERVRPTAVVPAPIDDARALRRFHQMFRLEEAIKQVEHSILDVEAERDDAEERLKNLRKDKSELVKELREAAGDEGDLPLLKLIADTDDDHPHGRAH